MSTSEKGIRVNSPGKFTDKSKECNQRNKTVINSEASSRETLTQLREYKELNKTTSYMENEENIEEEYIEEVVNLNSPFHFLNQYKLERDNIFQKKEIAKKPNFIFQRTKLAQSPGELTKQYTHKKCLKRSCSPLSRKDVLEFLSEKECKEMPSLGPITLAIARRKRSTSPLRIDQALFEDAKRKELMRLHNDLTVRIF